MSRIEIDQRIAELEAECGRLRDENSRLRELLGMTDQDALSNHRQSETTAHQTLSETEKIQLFRSLFRGREDVYPIRWENRQGRSGYSPACANEWQRPLCEKPRVKCADCANRLLLPVTDEVIRAHLTGRLTLGVYPLLVDETCWFLAADFDKQGWREDVLAFLAACDEMAVPAALERSRSGNGGHVWIFFAEPVAAVLARKLGAALLTLAMGRRPGIGLDSYDRLFPNQDTMPQGGFGNLIALPLQRQPRRAGNSLFVDWAFQPWPDQWAFLQGVGRMSGVAVHERVADAERSGDVVGLPRQTVLEPTDDAPWELPPSGSSLETAMPGPLPASVQVVLASRVFVEKAGLPPALINRLIRIAAFQNPEFHQAQALRMSTFGKPRVISCTEDHPQHIALPRGCLDAVRTLLTDHGIATALEDKRFSGREIGVSFQGQLRPDQQQASEALLHDDTGVLSATTAFGKTVVAAHVIAARGVNTLVLVHRRQLMTQWKQRLGQFLDLDPKRIGQIGGGKRSPGGEIDIAVIQSLNRKGVVDDIVADYGQIIVDEAHHVSAAGFEQVLSQVKARYVLGLTATPVRKDGKHPIITMQCGPIRYRAGAREQLKRSGLRHRVIVRETGFRLPEGDEEPAIQTLYNQLAADPERNALIFDDLLMALEEGRSPLLLTERVEHADALAEQLTPFARNVMVLKGGGGRKQTRAIRERMAEIPDDEERVLIATGRYIGEGFDDPRLDTLFLTLPVAWRGTLQQYVGRLHRDHDGKGEVRVYDYVDAQVPVLARMFAKRASSYRGMGYELPGGNAP
ncbi:MAG: TOTE conflict system archaeo-eukaryotic primase domain-containing protein [Gammaproteobacteria bacterium]